MNEEILGYDKHGEPIHKSKRGFIYTAACINCAICRAVIRGNGGPMYGSVCVECYDKSFRSNHETS